jgi:hypothetical protein
MTTTTGDRLRRLAAAADKLETEPGIGPAAALLTAAGAVPDLVAELGRLRAVAAVELRRHGVRVSRIAELAGVSSSAISQLIGSAAAELDADLDDALDAALDAALEEVTR